MVEQLQLLIRLQALDKTLFELLTEKEAIPGRLGDLSHEEEKLAASLVEAEDQLEQISARRKDLEQGGEELRSRLRRAENRLMRSQTQREYRAANAEIDEGKDAVKGNEELVLGLMETQEEVDARVKELKDKHAEVSAEAAKQRKELEARYKKVETEVKRLMRKRRGMTKGVEQELMERYDFIRERRQGVALAAVSKGACMVCHIQLPPQQFNELQCLDKIMTCPSCSRLLYWADAEPFANL